MGNYDFDYSIPRDFDNRVKQLLSQLAPNSKLAEAFAHCAYEYEVLDFAYYVGMRGDNWNKKALDLTFEGKLEWISTLENGKRIVKDALQKALRPSKSGLLVHEIMFLPLDEFNETPASNEDRLSADLRTAQAMLKDILDTCSRLSVNSTYSGDSSENSINDYVRDQLCAMGYSETKDQTRHGLSASGAEAGEVDILVTKDGAEVAIIEGLKLSYVNTSYISNHISKAIKNYNPLGAPTFIIVYYCGSEFYSFWDRYCDYLRTYSFQLDVTVALTLEASPNAATRKAYCILSRDGFDFPVYFLAVNLTN